jgi:hypothetical protein
LVENFYGNFADDFKGYAESEIYIGFICADVREEEDFVVEFVSYWKTYGLEKNWWKG